MGDNPEHLGSEASFAALCGVSPVERSSGSRQYRRLNRGGDRQANAALHRIVCSRLRFDARTRDYCERRIRGQDPARDRPMPRWLRCPRGLPPGQVRTIMTSVIGALRALRRSPFGKRACERAGPESLHQQSRRGYPRSHPAAPRRTPPGTHSPRPSPKRSSPEKWDRDPCHGRCGRDDDVHAHAQAASGFVAGGVPRHSKAVHRSRGSERLDRSRLVKRSMRWAR
ncbi:transposase [Streptomyces libani]